MKYKYTQAALDIVKTNPNISFTPTQGTAGSNGYDLSAAIPEEVTLLANEEVKIGTGIHIWLGSDTVGYGEEGIQLAGLLMPRSSIKGCMLTNCIGLIDSDYQGEVIASLWNRTDEPITIKPGQKMVQLVFVFTYIPEVMESVEDFNLNTIRGNGGFGSTL